MRTTWLAGVVILGWASTARAYVEVPHSLGQVVQQSTHIVLMEVEKVNTEKNLIIYKKVRDLKGVHPQAQIKHNIAKAGFHPREWQTIMKWVAPGKKAIFFHNGGASETCIERYWYQAYPGGEWWNMSHAEPFLLRTYYGSPEVLADAVAAILAGREIVVTCLADGNKNELHLQKGKLQRLKASLKLQNYDARRDFVGFGGDGVDIPEIKTISIMQPSSAGWKFLPAREAAAAGDRWRQPDFDDNAWRNGKTPIGYGEAEIANRKGTTVAEQGQPFLFRRVVEIPADLLAQKNTTFRLAIASDNGATVYLNGNMIDQDNADHEFSYWSREVELKAEQLRPGKNFLAAQVSNAQGSSDIYFDAEFSAEVTLPPRARPKPGSVATTNPATPAPAPVNPLTLPEKPGVLTVDKASRTLTIQAVVAPRKLPHLQEIYPLEVIATYPSPLGQKAHETVINFADVRPSSVQKALMELGLKPGQPAKGEGARAEGPQVLLLLEFTDPQGKNQRMPIEKMLADRRTGQLLPPLTWHFTGSALKQPDPEKDDKVPGADLTGTLISLFPVTDETIFQSSLTLKDEGMLKLEIVKGLLPAEGKPVKLIIQVK